MSTRVERWLMNKCNINYATARTLADQGRAKLGLPKTAPLTPELEQECLRLAAANGARVPEPIINAKVSGPPINSSISTNSCCSTSSESSSSDEAAIKVAVKQLASAAPQIAEKIVSVSASKNIFEQQEGKKKKQPAYLASKPKSERPASCPAPRAPVAYRKTSAPPPPPPPTSSSSSLTSPSPAAPYRKALVFSEGTFDSHYKIGNLLGEGAFATVHEATHKKSKDVFAVKIIDGKALTRDEESAVKDEIEVMNELRGHANIVCLHDAFHEKSNFKSDYFIVMEQMRGGELFDRIVEKESYSELEARDVCLSFFSAIQYCHSKRIAHRDLKPENLLLVSSDCDSTIKLADFGFAKKIRTPNSLKTQCGSPGYVAPEVIDINMPGYDVTADMWSLGVILFILLGGYAPFDGPDPFELNRQIQECEYEFKEQFWRPVSSDAKNLISSLLCLDTKKRLTADQALQSKWVKASQSSLAGKNLDDNLVAIRRFNGKRKLRAAVKTAIAAKRLSLLIGK